MRLGFVSALLAEAERVDTDEDARFGVRVRPHMLLGVRADV